MLMKRDRSSLLVIDVQERLAPAMFERERVVQNAAILLRAAADLGVPVLASEQYPKGLGRSLPDIAALFPAGAVAEKTTFSCAGDDGYLRRFSALGRDQAVICGIETHVCVLQTALDLLARDVEVFVVADAVSSRTPENRALGLERLRANGAEIVSTEMVLFEWLERAGTPEFKELSRLIR